jgi:hypothetical protein
MANGNQIHLLGDFRREEAKAYGYCLPGYLLEQIPSSDYFQPHSVEGGIAERIVAEIDALQGGVLTDWYASAALVSANIENPGNEVQMWLKAGENVAINTKLISAGDGMLIAEASATSGVVVRQVIAVAREAKDLSGSTGVDTLIRVRLL